MDMIASALQSLAYTVLAIWCAITLAAGLYVLFGSDEDHYQSPSILDNVRRIK